MHVPEGRAIIEIQQHTNESNLGGTVQARVVKVRIVIDFDTEDI